MRKLSNKCLLSSGIGATASPCLHRSFGRKPTGKTGLTSRVANLRACRALFLKPAGSGSQDHLDEVVPQPEEIELAEGQFELGRESSAQIIVPYPTVSSRHAMLRIAGESVSVTDLNSTNGTYIEDNELVPMEAESLLVGQNVIFGDSYLAQYRLERRIK